MSKITCKCENCEKSFEKLQKDFKKSKQHFCSRACYNNSKIGLEPIHLTLANKTKERKEYFCDRCNKSLGIGHNTVKTKKLCLECNKNYVDWSKITISDLKAKYDINAFHARLRQLSRSNYLNSDKPKMCCNCGYNKHYEVCHIKDVRFFEETDSIAQVNHVDNLIGYCRNCHWEFDNGLLVPECGIEPQESSL
jgi:hypothetical protein